MRERLQSLIMKKWPVYLAIYFFVVGLSYAGVLSPYVVMVLSYICIDSTMTLGLNLTNGYMGETNLGFAGFMGVGAYVSVVLTTLVFRLEASTPWFAKQALFCASVLAGGLTAALAGFVLSIPSFKTRGDYLAVVTYGFNMIIINILNNIEALGGARGYQGRPPDHLILKLTTFTWVYAVLILCIYACRNFVNSAFGRDALAIRENEVAADIMGVDTRKAKTYAFTLSSFFGGIAGGFYVHLIQYAHPSMFGMFKSVDLLAMLYLGGMGTIAGPILGATIYNLLLEGLRIVLHLVGVSQVWRMVVTPTILIFIMLRKPWGLAGHKELEFFLPPEALPHDHGHVPSGARGR